MTARPCCTAEAGAARGRPRRRRPDVWTVARQPGLHDSLRSSNTGPTWRAPRSAGRRSGPGPAADTELPGRGRPSPGATEPGPAPGRGVVEDAERAQHPGEGPVGRGHAVLHPAVEGRTARPRPWWRWGPDHGQVPPTASTTTSGGRRPATGRSTWTDAVAVGRRPWTSAAGSHWSRPPAVTRPTRRSAGAPSSRRTANVRR